MENHYRALLTHRGADGEEIRRQYLKLARKFHPDKGGSVEQFAPLAEAYSVLSNAENKRAYDARLALLSAVCVRCKGSGFLRVQRSMREVNKYPCEKCGGSGCDEGNTEKAKVICCKKAATGSAKTRASAKGRGGIPEGSPGK